MNKYIVSLVLFIFCTANLLAQDTDTSGSGTPHAESTIEFSRESILQSISDGDVYVCQIASQLVGQTAISFAYIVGKNAYIETYTIFFSRNRVDKVRQKITPSPQFFSKKRGGNIEIKSTKIEYYNKDSFRQKSERYLFFKDVLPTFFDMTNKEKAVFLESMLPKEDTNI